MSNTWDESDMNCFFHFVWFWSFQRTSAEVKRLQRYIPPDRIIQPYNEDDARGQRILNSVLALEVTAKRASSGGSIVSDAHMEKLRAKVLVYLRLAFVLACVISYMICVCVIWISLYRPKSTWLIKT